MANVIAEAAKLAEVPSKTELAKAGLFVKKIRVEIEKARDSRRQLFGIEEFAKTDIDAKIERLEAKKKKYESINRYKLPCVDMQIFGWRWKNGWPKLALIGLNSPTVSFKVQCRNVGYNTYTPFTSPAIPKPIFNLHRDVFETLKTMAKRKRKTIILETNFTGLIPQDTRKKIIQAKKAFKEVYIVAETSAEKWKIREKEATVIKPPPPTNYDPLVVGWDGNNLWLVDQFDLTTLENYVKSEFTV